MSKKLNLICLKKLIKANIFKIFNKLHNSYRLYLNEEVYNKHKFSKKVRINNVQIDGNIFIGDYTYINEFSRLSTGKNSCITIGEHCAIGRYVHITSKTHSLVYPTSQEGLTQNINLEKNVKIGSHVWIGDKVFIKEGIEIGDFAIIGANSVVTRNVNDFEIVGGVPAKHIKYNKEHNLFKSIYHEE